MYDRTGENLLKAFISLYGKAKSMDKSIFRNIAGCYHNRNSSQIFYGHNFISKALKKIFPGQITF